jgi:hypothetical protein
VVMVDRQYRRTGVIGTGQLLCLDSAKANIDRGGV